MAAKLKQLSAVCMAIPLLGGCDALIDCLDSDGPVFNKKTLINPVLNQVYSETISVSVENEPHDDRFDYEFILTGKLPDQIEYQSSGRLFIFSGTAIESGTYTFDIRVRVDEGLNPQESGLCRTTRTQSFQFTVQDF